MLWERSPLRVSIRCSQLHHGACSCIRAGADHVEAAQVCSPCQNNMGVFRHGIVARHATLQSCTQGRLRIICGCAVNPHKDAGTRALSAVTAATASVLLMGLPDGQCRTDGLAGLCGGRRIAIHVRRLRSIAL